MIYCYQRDTPLCMLISCRDASVCHTSGTFWRWCSQIFVSITPPYRNDYFDLVAMHPYLVLNAIYCKFAQNRPILHCREDRRDALPLNVSTKCQWSVRWPRNKIRIRPVQIEHATLYSFGIGGNTELTIPVTRSCWCRRRWSSDAFGSLSFA